MTEQDIDGLPAGRELDLLIATKLFKRPVCDRAEAVLISNEAMEPDGEFLPPRWDDWYAYDWYFADGSAVHGLELVGKYSTWDQAACEVLEALSEAGWSITIQNCHKPDWCVIVADDDASYQASGNLSLAICRAALKAALEVGASE